jgi:beta-lactamase class A
MIRSNIITALIFISGLIGGAGTVWLFEARDVENTAIRQDNEEYTYINPLIECESGESARTKEMSFIEDDVEERMERIKQEKKLTSVALYFRDLRNGPWIGIDEDLDFAQASLTKVPIFLTLLKMSEVDPGLLDRRMVLVVEEEQKIVQNIKPQTSAKSGEEYSVRELMEIMIIHSDNVSLYALRSLVTDEGLRNTFAQIGVPFTFLGDDLRLSVREYASFFRILYNASYLNRANSEYALGILARTAYDQGLRGEIPKDVAIAHKFGERSNLGLDGPNQLHDCGVVYFPGSPYLLCIMTRGENLTDMQQAIQDISTFVYRDVLSMQGWGD